MAEKLWIRAGDGDGYNEFGEDLDAAANYLFEMGAHTGLRRMNDVEPAKLIGEGFEGNNYISAYWGGDDAGDDMIRGLDDEELTILNDFLDGLVEETDNELVAI